MKTIDLKALMLLTFLIASLLSLPVMGFAQEEGEGDNVEKTEEYGAFKNYRGGFGGIFGDNMGYGGELIGSVFEMLLLDGLDLEDHETLESVYVLSASKEETYEGEYDFEAQGDTQEIHFLPFVDELNTTYARHRDGINDYMWNESEYGYAYCVVKKSGGFGYNLTVGAALTLIIWDYDKSFIIAAQKVLDWASKFREAEDKDEVNSEIVAEGVEILTWLLTHINEIFTGDELFVFNPIVWQSLEMNPMEGFNITKTWRYTGKNIWDIDPINDDLISSNPALAGNLTSTNFNAWLGRSEAYRDYYMQWLLDPYTDSVDLIQTVWTQFSFDLLQLWVKEFHVEIDLEELSKGEDAKMKKVFESADVEFYLFTHHLAGAFLYDDVDNSTDITVEYENVIDPDTGLPLIVNGTEAKIPTTNEITHQLVLGNVADFDFSNPKIDEEDSSVTWGLTLLDANMSAVPIGVDLNSALNVPKEELRYISFGLKFETDIEEPNDKGEIEASADVKLEHIFAPWNDNETGIPSTKSDILGLDLAILYVSSILHFDLHIEKGEDKEDIEPEDDLDPDHSQTSHTLKIGDYLDEDNHDKLELVDIAGAGYIIGNDTDKNGSPDNGGRSCLANSSIINLALWEGESKSTETDPGDKDDTDDDFSADVEAAASWNILLYAVCYPDFNGSGLGIWHDPTFSVYMVFTPESAGFWALILLIAGVGLAGVAAILIKKKKEGF